ncbi:VOC family protein [Cumulibacter manganitolerans]|uniref:VOC family protein n=1 Tax=Cumulibacter manganitolerans TaxID=1884992 RepID=UPI0012948D2B|nr:VOC family protein [Cumulibacter manganitolerans]
MIRWYTALIDLPAADLEATTAFWAGATGYARSERDDRHLTRLLRPDGDPYLAIRPSDVAHSRVHIDLHVDDVAAYADRAVALGATRTAGADHAAVMRSPGGLGFRLGPEAASTVPPPATFRGVRSRVNQVCIDVPAALWSSESDFWSGLIERPYRQLTRATFRLLQDDPRFPLRILLQRDSRLRQVAAHLDVGTTDRDAEILRHIALGAVEIEEFAEWTRLMDPSGMPYCITDRDPVSGRPR